MRDWRRQAEVERVGAVGCGATPSGARGRTLSEPQRSLQSTCSWGRINPIRSFFRLVRRLFFLACVLIAGFAVAGYAAGWVRFEHDRQRERATIEVETGEVKRAVEKTAEKAQELVGRYADDLLVISPATAPGTCRSS